MRPPVAGWSCAVCALTALAVAQTPQPTTIVPAAAQVAAKAEPGRRDLSQWPPLLQQFYLSSQRGSEWLFRMNQATGSFAPGWKPDLNVPLESDHFLRQAGATLALARAAKFHQNEAYATRARQALLTLLADTGPDSRDPRARCTTAPSTVVNRLAAAGLLTAIIHELPAPADDLLLQGEQLAYFIALQQKPDGSLSYTDTPEAVADPDGVNTFPGVALYGLARSNIARPAPWKAEIVRKACVYYRNQWRGQKHPTFAATQTAAYAETFVQSKDRARDAVLADFVFEMNDWLCGQQYEQLDLRHPQWRGGFPEFASGKPAAGAPQIGTAQYAAGLCDACRVTRQKPDGERYAKYRESAARALQFVTTLQFTESNTQHFAPGFRQQMLLGGFFTAPDDGTLRIENNQYAVSAFVGYMTGAVEVK